jgi:hypothetical protein
MKRFQLEIVLVAKMEAGWEEDSLFTPVSRSIKAEVLPPKISLN